MAFMHGSKATFSLDQFSPATLVNLSTYISSISFPVEMDTASIDVMGGTYKQSVTGLAGGTISLQGKYDPTLDAHMNGILFGVTGGASVSFQYDPQGTSSGRPRYTGECWLTSYEVTTDVGDAGSWSATLQTTGTITRATQ
jgi:hypothetical protein